MVVPPTQNRTNVLKICFYHVFSPHCFNAFVKKKKLFYPPTKTDDLLGLLDLREGVTVALVRRMKSVV